MREPYVGEGRDGCLRSAAIDRSEAEGLDREDPRREELLASAQRWEEQAETIGLDSEGHVDYPHEPGRLYDCPACEAQCHCTAGHTECIFEGEHNGLAAPDYD